jgi:uncharacterized protein YqeY
MSLEKKIDNDLKVALKAKEEIKVATLRLLRSALKNIAIEKRQSELNDQDVLVVIRKELKKRQDSMEAYQKANRQDLFIKEQQEADILDKYLPALLSEENIKKIVNEVFDSGINQFGPLMKEVMTRAQGLADGNLVQRLVKEKLGT